MKTFNQDFNYYNKTYSLVNLYLKNTYSDKNMKNLKYIMILSLILFLIGDLMLIFKYYEQVGNIIMILSTLPIIIYIFLIQTIRARKELKSQELPLPNLFYEWKSDELLDLKITKVFEDYKSVNSEIIQKRIDIANRLRNEPMKDPFVLFEKFFEYAGKQILTILIGLLIFALNKDFSNINFNTTIRLIIGLLMFSGLFIFIWKFMFKKPFLDSQFRKNEKLNDYIFTLENILLMRI